MLPEDCVSQAGSYCESPTDANPISNNPLPSDSAVVTVAR